jgi:hypothetical protein
MNHPMAASVAQIDPGIAHLEGPYVGLRPFERTEKAIFFGRGLDAGFLKDKIFSARLTLLYAPSGVGKSSILRTLVTPALEEQHAWVKYVDNWAADDPCAALKARLVKFASELGIPDAGEGSPTLTEIVARIATADNRTGILILDQFEEFLVTHGKQLDPLRKELATLVRNSKLDIRVVLSLRQEFLAALEPFRNEILNLFQSTYLLDSLDDRGLRDAIEKPVEIFGGEYESELTAQLVADLRASEDREALATSRAPVDLPMMQIVCGRLWQETLNRKQTTLTLAAYKSLGGADKILETYVRDVMRKRWSDKLLTAKLMRLLAPASGLKKPYTAVELAENDSLNLARVCTELERLSEQRILRVREYHGQKLYELQHDAFVRFISPWRDEILKRDKVRRRFVAAGKMVALAVALTLIYYSGVGNYLEARQAEKLVSNLRSLPQEERDRVAESRFDSATTDLLFRWKRLGRLGDLLKTNGDLIPEGYGLANGPPPATADADSVGKNQTPGELECPFLCVHYSARRPLDERYFNQEWRYLATSFFAERGIPVPLEVTLVKEPAFPVKRIDISVGSQQSNTLKTLATVSIPSYEDSVFIAPVAIHGIAKDFLDRYIHGIAKDPLDRDRQHPDWIEVPTREVKPFGPLTVVPSWSRPVWKVAGAPATDGRGMAALYLASYLINNPAPLFTTDAMTLLLRKARQTCPQSVNEAIAARTYDNLPRDFAELVKRGQPLTELPSVLDALAAYPASDPANTSEATAEHVYADLRSQKSRLPSRLSRPWKNDGGAPASSSQTGHAYDQVEASLASLERPVKVYLSRDLEQSWFTGKGAVLGVRLNDLHDQLIAQYGVELRGPLVFPSSGQYPLSPGAYRIEAINPNARQCSVHASDAKLDQFIETLNKCIVASRMDWVLAEDAYMQRQTTAAGMQNWLNAKYSLTGQKDLMRAVVGGRSSSDEKPAEEDSLWPSDWLIGSLIFWSHVDDPFDTAKMADDLRATQRARLFSVQPPNAANPAFGLVATGIRALEGDQIPAAEDAFARAVASDKSVAVQSFLAAWPLSVKSIELRNAAKLCNDNTPPYLSYGSYHDARQRIALDEALRQWGSSLPPATHRRLGLCSIQASSYSSHSKLVALESSLVMHSDPGGWSPEEARWLAEKTLSDYDPYSDSPGVRDAAATLLRSAVIRLPAPDSARAFRFVYGEYDRFMLDNINQPGPKEWRRRLLRELAESRPEPAAVMYLVGELSESDRPEDLEEVQRLTEHPQQAVQSERDPKIRQGDLAVILYYRASALQRLSELSMVNPALHISDHGAEVSEILAELSKQQGYEEAAMSLQMEFLIERGDFANAIKIGQSIFALYPLQAKNDALPYQLLLLSELMTGDQTAAAATAKAAEEAASTSGIPNDSKANLMFTASLGQIVTRSPSMDDTGSRFLLMDHPYVPYIAMMLYSMASAQTQQDARSMLLERWKLADKPHWKERLRGGDETAWREMLLGMYVGEVSPHDVFDPLKDDASFANSDFRFLPSTRQDMLCEAWFYSALLSELKNDMKTRNADLQKVVDTGVTYYIEYDLAKFMLAKKNPQR